jgi:hypothetical protein
MEVPSSPGSRRITGSDMTRRDLMEVAVVTGGALVGGQLMPGFIPQAAAQAGTPPTPLELVLRVNGTEHRLTFDPRTTLLDALREHLHLTGSKKGCGLGQCGACTVLMDGKRVKACLSLAALWKDARSRLSRASPKASNSTPCKPPSSRETPSSAAIAPPDRSWPASPASTRATPARRKKSATG